MAVLRALTPFAATFVASSTYLRRYDVGSSYRAALVATVAVVMFAGLWYGSSFAFRLAAWQTRRAIAFRPMMPTWRDIVVILLVAVAWFLPFCVWCVVIKDSLADMVKSCFVLLSVLAASAALGSFWATLFESARVGAFFGAMTWTPPVTAFLWVPRLVAPSKPLLEIALNANPASGVISALGAQKILWSPGIYERLPYAEYGAGFWNASTHAIGWIVVTALFGGASQLVRRWRRT
jgi:hypothetical protein